MEADIEKIEELKRLRAEKRRRDNLPHLYGQKFYNWSREFFESTNPDTLLLCGNQVGKGHLIGSHLPTVGGFKKVEDISKGEILFDSRGECTTVTGVFPDKNIDSYIITFDDGSTSKVWGEHRWKCQTAKNRFKKYRRDGTQYEGYGEWQVLTTEEIIKVGGYTPEAKNAKAKVAIPVCDPVQYPERDLPVDPYVMGAMLGDGAFGTLYLTCGDREVIDRANTKNCEVTIHNNCYYVKLHQLYERVDRTMRSHTKYIPEEYLTASVQQRLDLLHGLMDTDGSISRGYVIEYASASKELIDQMVELINSLGGVINSRDERPTWYTYKGERLEGKHSYRIRFKMQVNPFWLPRKANEWRKDTRYKHQRLIEKIEYIGKMDGVCFEVDSPDRTYLSGKEYIVTHNTSIQLRKMVHWATATELWPKLWPKAHKMGKTPNVFWFLITDYNTATSLFHDKMVPEFLPRNEMRTDPKYGWKAEFKNKMIHSISFNSGVTIYFHAYSKQAATLQSSTVYAIFTDEELPADIHGELKFRTAAVDGYYHMVFTATLGQELWYRAFERIGEKDEAFSHAKKIRATVYDCLEYEDGDKETPWTMDKIDQLKLSCSTENEVLKRVYGRFVVDEGLVLSEFIPSQHVIKPFDIPEEWILFSGVDIGSGGKSGHKGAIAFIAVKPDFTYGVLFRGWKGNSQETTTSADILEKYRKIRGNMDVSDQRYDWASKDFYTFATRAGESFNKANKDHDQGWELLNTILKLGMFEIFDLDELVPFRYEAGTLTHDKLRIKRVADDDMLDATRYAATAIPWDISKVVEMYNGPEKKKKEEVEKSEIEIRREMVFGDGKDDSIDEFFADVDEELDEWAELY